MSMSDAHDAFEASMASTEPPAAPSVTEPPSATEPPAAPAVTEPPAATEAPAGTDDLSKFGEHADYIRDLRKEAAERRVALKGFEEAFNGYNDDQRAAFLGLAQGLVSDRTATAKQLQEIATAILEAEGGSGSGDKLPDASDGTLTKAEVEKMLADRDAHNEQQREVAKSEQQIIAQAEGLGYKPGTPEYKRLMFEAINFAEYDLDKAHANLEAQRQAHVDAYVAGKANGGGVTVPDATGAPVNNAEKPKGLDGARDAVETWLNSGGAS